MPELTKRGKVVAVALRYAGFRGAERTFITIWRSNGHVGVYRNTKRYADLLARPTTARGWKLDVHETEIICTNWVYGQ